MDRRKFIKTLASACGILSGKNLFAQNREKPSPKEFIGILTDISRCIGCRSCEVACGKANNMHVPQVEKDGALNKIRKTSEKQLTVVNRFKTSKGEFYVKKQCMHCWQPACASACLTNAMYKTKEGPIIWREEMCMGCRYCMVACPFEIPKYEYNSRNPKVQKCTMCFRRLEKGQLPACVETCPRGALTFGLKRDLMEIARTRIYRNPDRYEHHIYGEHEAGGTGWLYISPVPFNELGFKTDLGSEPYPGYTREFLYAVPGVLLVVPPLLYGLSQLTKRDEDVIPARGRENHD